MTEREALRRAKEVLLERGWYQGGYAEGDLGGGRVCVRGALGVAVYGDPYLGCVTAGPNHRATLRLYQAGARGPGFAAHPHQHVSLWNDDVATSIDEVIAMIDRAIESLPAEKPERELVAA